MIALGVSTLNDTWQLRPWHLLCSHKSFKAVVVIFVFFIGEKPSGENILKRTIWELHGILMNEEQSSWSSSENRRSKTCVWTILQILSKWWIMLLLYRLPCTFFHEKCKTVCLMIMKAWDNSCHVPSCTAAFPSKYTANTYSGKTCRMIRCLYSNVLGNHMWNAQFCVYMYSLSDSVIDKPIGLGGTIYFRVSIHVI